MKLFDIALLAGVAFLLLPRQGEAAAPTQGGTLPLAAPASFTAAPTPFLQTPLQYEVGVDQGQIQYWSGLKSKVGRQLADYQAGYKAEYGTTSGMFDQPEYQSMAATFDDLSNAITYGRLPEGWTPDYATLHRANREAKRGSLI